MLHPEDVTRVEAAFGAEECARRHWRLQSEPTFSPAICNWPPSFPASISPSPGASINCCAISCVTTRAEPWPGSNPSCSALLTASSGTHRRRRHDGTLLDRLKGYRVREQAPIPPVAGKLTRVVGLTLEAIGCRAAIGSPVPHRYPGWGPGGRGGGVCRGSPVLDAERAAQGVIPGARVVPVTEDHGIPVGMSLLGRVIDGIGQPLDGLGPILSSQTVQFAQHRINPLARRPIHQPMDVGYGPSMPCSPWAGVSAWGCSPAPVSANPCCLA